MIDENTINERIKILDGDIAKVQTTMQSLEKTDKGCDCNDERTTRCKTTM